MVEHEHLSLEASDCSWWHLRLGEKYHAFADSRPLHPLQGEGDRLTCFGCIDRHSFALNGLDDRWGEGAEAVRAKKDGVPDRDGSSEV